MMSGAASRDAASSSRGAAIGALADASAPEAATGSRPRTVRGLQIQKSFWRFGVIGVLSNAAGYSTYLLITWLGGGPKTSMTLLYAVGVLLGFIGNREWVFQHDGPGWPSLIRYGLAYLVGYGLDWLLLHVFVDKLGYPHELVQAAAVLIVAAYLFPTLRFFVFRRVQESQLSLSSP
jgi:putative flippase GtrA